MTGSPNPSPSADSSLVQREAVLLVVLAAMAAMAFVVTREVARAERAANVADAAYWFAEGERQLHDGHAAQAVTSLRRATGLDRGNRPYALTLARALSAQGQAADARRVLLVLRDQVPDDPDVNMTLARLAAARRDLAEAHRFYQNALYAIWPPDREDERQRLRVELVRLLLAHGERGRALSEVVALGTNLPDTPGARVEAGELFLAAGDPLRALDQFARALRQDPAHAAALAGAGEASFESRDYAGARRYFSRAGSLPDRLAELNELARLVLAHDPLEPRLTLAARQQRLGVAVSRAAARLDACLAQREDAAPAIDPLRADLAALSPDMGLRALGDKPELVGHGVDLVYRAQQAAAEVCGAPEGLDRALLLIGDRHRDET